MLYFLFFGLWKEYGFAMTVRHIAILAAVDGVAKICTGLCPSRHLHDSFFRLGSGTAQPPGGGGAPVLLELDFWSGFGCGGGLCRLFKF